MASETPGAEPHTPPSDSAAYDAQAALDDLTRVRAQFGHRLATPWWYKVLSALVVATLFANVGVPYESIRLGSFTTGFSLVVVAVAVGPLVLRELLKRTTGASFDRYSNSWAVPSLALIAFLVLCVALQKFANLDLAPLVGAAIAFVFVFLYEEWTDRRLARGVFSSPGSRDRM